jgi:hypothetical protein
LTQDTAQLGDYITVVAMTFVLYNNCNNNSKRLNQLNNHLLLKKDPVTIGVLIIAMEFMRAAQF